jgi:hypothetical protein
MAKLLARRAAATSPDDPHPVKNCLRGELRRDHNSEFWAQIFDN